MKAVNYFSIACITLIFVACQTNESSQSHPLKGSIDPDSVLFSFSFVGCNRLDSADVQANDSTTANLEALNLIFNDVCAQKQRPELFFFLGDLVLGETNISNLNKQLNAWDELYQQVFEPEMKQSGIELVAVPGNHELLYGVKLGKSKNEYPLPGSTAIWMKYMRKYMPKDRDVVKGKDQDVNQMTFSFIRHNVGFIVMNTDTYNAPIKNHPRGMEGQIPLQWIFDKIEEYQSNSSIKHIFVLGHKPYYVDGKPLIDHKGLPAGPKLWPQLKAAHVAALLSAHCHDYQRSQDTTKMGTYQIIAGNGGSKGPATFFGYTTIYVMKDGTLRLISRGYNKPSPYYADVPNALMTVRDSTILTWTANRNP